MEPADPADTGAQLRADSAVLQLLREALGTRDVFDQVAGLRDEFDDVQAELGRLHTAEAFGGLDPVAHSAWRARALALLRLIKSGERRS